MNRKLANWQWDDVRFFLAVARAGSLSAAARTLGVGHVTVGRRVALLEKRLGVTLPVVSAEYCRCEWQTDMYRVRRARSCFGPTVRRSRHTGGGVGGGGCLAIMFAGYA